MTFDEFVSLMSRLVEKSTLELPTPVYNCGGNGYRCTYATYGEGIPTRYGGNPLYAEYIDYKYLTLRHGQCFGGLLDWKKKDLDYIAVWLPEYPMYTVRTSPASAGKQHPSEEYDRFYDWFLSLPLYDCITSKSVRYRPENQLKDHPGSWLFIEATVENFWLLGFFLVQATRFVFESCRDFDTWVELTGDHKADPWKVMLLSCVFKPRREGAGYEVGEYSRHGSPSDIVVVRGFAHAVKNALGGSEDSLKNRYFGLSRCAFRDLKAVALNAGWQDPGFREKSMRLEVTLEKHLSKIGWELIERRKKAAVDEAVKPVSRFAAIQRVAAAENNNYVSFTPAEAAELLARTYDACTGVTDDI